ncbi:hypothetical protein YPPY54_1182, partial [Yersinia pestis PY-54]
MSDLCHYTVIGTFCLIFINFFYCTTSKTSNKKRTRINTVIW